MTDKEEGKFDDSHSEISRIRRQFRRYITGGNAGGIFSISTFSGAYLGRSEGNRIPEGVMDGAILFLAGLVAMGLALFCDLLQCYFDIHRTSETKSTIVSVNLNDPQKFGLIAHVCRYFERFFIVVGVVLFFWGAGSCISHLSG